MKIKFRNLLKKNVCKFFAVSIFAFMCCGAIFPSPAYAESKSVAGSLTLWLGSSKEGSSASSFGSNTSLFTYEFNFWMIILFICSISLIVLLVYLYKTGKLKSKTLTIFAICLVLPVGVFGVRSIIANADESYKSTNQEISSSAYLNLDEEGKILDNELKILNNADGTIYVENIKCSSEFASLFPDLSGTKITSNSSFTCKLNCDVATSSLLEKAKESKNKAKINDFFSVSYSLSQPVNLNTVKTSGKPGSVKVASVSIDVDNHPSGKDVVIRMLDWINKASDEGAKLVAFPECSFGTGSKSADDYLDTVTGIVDDDEKRDFYKSGLVEDQDNTKLLIEKAKERNIYIVFNTYECDSSLVPPTLYNVSALVGPEGFVGKYHKVHMPGGEQLLASPGKDYPVFVTSIGKVGMLICFDFAFPEAHRCITLNGAEIVVLSTAAPLTNLKDPENDKGLDFLRTQIKASSYSNQVNYVVSNNANPGAFAHSMIFNPCGELLGETEGFNEGMVVADLGIIKEELLQARIFENGGLNVLKSREPQTYGKVCESVR